MVFNITSTKAVKLLQAREKECGVHDEGVLSKSAAHIWFAGK